MLSLVWRDHLHSDLPEFRIERITVACLTSDQSLTGRIDEAIQEPGHGGVHRGYRQFR